MYQSRPNSVHSKEKTSTPITNNRSRALSGASNPSQLMAPLALRSRAGTTRPRTHMTSGITTIAPTTSYPAAMPRRTPNSPQTTDGSCSSEPVAEYRNRETAVPSTTVSATASGPTGPVDVSRRIRPATYPAIARDNAQRPAV